MKFHTYQAPLQAQCASREILTRKMIAFTVMLKHSYRKEAYFSLKFIILAI